MLSFYNPISDFSYLLECFFSFIEKLSFNISDVDIIKQRKPSVIGMRENFFPFTYSLYRGFHFIGTAPLEEISIDWMNGFLKIFTIIWHGDCALKHLITAFDNDEIRMQ